MAAEPRLNKDCAPPVGDPRAPVRIAIIVPVFNDSSNLGACLAALRESATRDSEIIVVDDASTDQSAAVAEKAGARVVSLRENGGLDGRGTVPPPRHAVKSSFSWTRTWPWLPGVPAPRRYCPCNPDSFAHQRPRSQRHLRQSPEDVFSTAGSLTPKARGDTKEESSPQSVLPDSSAVCGASNCSNCPDPGVATRNGCRTKRPEGWMA